jgi:hypothetical protein
MAIQPTSLNRPGGSRRDRFAQARAENGRVRYAAAATGPRGENEGPETAMGLPAPTGLPAQSPLPCLSENVATCAAEAARC